MGKLLSQELTNLASLKTNSVLHNCSCEALEQSSQYTLLVELEKEAPTTLSLLKQCAHIKIRAHKPRREGGKSRCRIPNEEAAVGMCFAILMHARSQRMILVQRLISILLYGSHTPKQVSHYSQNVLHNNYNINSPLTFDTAHCIQVYRRLNQLLQCLSNKQTLSLVDKMGQNHDHILLQRRNDNITGWSYLSIGRLN